MEGMTKDFSELAKSTGLDESQITAIADLFVQSSDSDLQRLQRAMEQGSARQVIEAAHSIKGAAANFGFKSIFEAASDIEAYARMNDFQGFAEQVRLIREKLDAITRTLKENST